MKGKLSKTVLACAIAFFASTSVFAMTSTEMLNKLDSIKADIDVMKQEYETVLVTYPGVINSLSAESQQALETLTNNLMADDFKAKVDAAKAELAISSAQDADKVLAAINDIQTDAKNLLEDNRDVIREMKSNYNDLTVNDAKNVMNKVVEITNSLGVKKDTAATHNSLIDILNDVYNKEKDINIAIEDALMNEEVAVKNTLTIENIENVFKAIDSKSQENVVDALIKAIDEAQGTDSLKQKLINIKSQINEMKAKLAEIESLDEEAIILFSDTQKQSLSNKIADIEREYITFAKKVINNYATKYLNTVVEDLKRLSVDEVINKLNNVLNYYDEYNSTINNLKSGNFLASNLTNTQEAFVKKIGILAALDIIDLNKYNKDFVNNNFSQEISLLKNYAIDTVVDYINFVDTTMKTEIESEVKTNKANIAQLNIKNINIGRFNTIGKIKSLKARIDGYNFENLEMKEALNQGFGLVNNIYYNNILETIEKIMLLESEKQDKKYEFNSLHYQMIASNFMTLADLKAILGIPSGFDVLSVQNLEANKLKTGSTFTIKLSDNVYQTYTNVVLGDVYADGIVDARDYMAIKNYIMEKDTLDDARIAAANTYRDGNVNAQDYMKIKNQIMEKDTISL